jgi:hypothetical protein
VLSTPALWIGLAIMILSETMTLLKVEPFWSWNTPIAWTGFIIFADAVVWRVRGDSWIRSAPREFLLLALVSIPLWLLFEGYNRVLRNWHYVGLPENPALRYFGYAWSFATIWPALFVGAELIAVWRNREAPLKRGPTYDGVKPGPTGDGVKPGTTYDGVKRIPTDDVVGHRFSGAEFLSVALGALMLASPYLVSPATAPYMAAPVWLGFIFLLDPINARLGGESLWADWRAGRRDRLVNLVLSGFLCGVLWELWNYWSRAKWHYTVPIMERLKIFEMPLPGYVGFPAFALECFTMYVFVRRLFTRGGRRIAL